MIFVQQDPQTAVLQVSVFCAVSFMSGSSARFWVVQYVAVHFGGPVSDHDAEIVSLREGAIPNNARATHWKKWAAI